MHVLNFHFLTNGGIWLVQVTKGCLRLLEDWRMGIYSLESRVDGRVLWKLQGNVMLSESYPVLHHTLWYNEQQPQCHVEYVRPMNLSPKLLIRIFSFHGITRLGRPVIALIRHPKVHVLVVTWFPNATALRGGMLKRLSDLLGQGHYCVCQADKNLLQQQKSN